MIDRLGHGHSPKKFSMPQNENLSNLKFVPVLERVLALAMN
jgi:hypothetical protein